jgi:hypothetical protein
MRLTLHRFHDNPEGSARGVLRPHDGHRTDLAG